MGGSAHAAGLALARRAPTPSGAHVEGSRGGEFAMGRMRCLSALSEWQQLARVSEHVWPQLSARQQLEMAPVLAGVRWHCQHYNAMASLTALIDPKTCADNLLRLTPSPSPSPNPNP